jgi:hypothetical protein
LLLKTTGATGASVVPPPGTCVQPLHWSAAAAGGGVVPPGVSSDGAGGGTTIGAGTQPEIKQTAMAITNNNFFNMTCYPPFFLPVVSIISRFI